MPSSMCDLARTLPLLVGRLLDREGQLKRGRFREETMTDIFTGALAAFAGPELVIEYPLEADTGSDLDLRFWHVATGHNLHLRIQAKRLSAAYNGMKLAKISHRSYKELLHMPPTSTVFQFQTLANAPPPWIPLYMFYNHQSAVDSPYFKGGVPAVSGVNLAFAKDVADELENKLNSAKAKQRLHNKRLSHLRPHLFDLDAILCPSGNWGGAGVPPPSVVSAALLERWAAHGKGTARTKDEYIVMRKLMEPHVLNGTRLGGRISDGPSIRIDQTLARPVINFISGRTDDDRTPTIAMEA